MLFRSGTIPNKGAKNKERKNRIPVTSVVIPVRPPAATPDALSTKEVTVLVPNTAPTVVAMASDRNACLLFLILPSASIRLVLVQTAINVPAVSNKSMKMNVNTTINMSSENNLWKSRAPKIGIIEGGRLKNLNPSPK